MPLREELKDRVWPTRPQNVDVGDYAKGCYVREGRVVNRVLGLPQGLSEPIPPGECAITALCLGSNGKVYGATSGKRSHLLYYDPDPGADGVCDIGVLDGAAAVRRSLVADDRGVIFGGVSATVEPGGEGCLFAYDTRGDHMAEFGARRGQVERLSVPVQGQCVAALAIDRRRRRLYGLSTPGGVFFVHDLDEHSTTEIGPINAGRQFSEALVVGLSGHVYGVGAAGRVFRFDPEAGRIEHLDLRIPSVAGRDFYNKLDAVALDPQSGLIYGGGSADGVLFVFDPSTATIRSLGKVTAEPRVRALTVGLDGSVYGVSGEADGMAHLFRYDPAEHELRDLGIPLATVQRHWHGYEFDAACTGRWGEIYLGESDRISHLFVYFPPVRVRPRPENGSGA